ncbi:sensor histidine kinase [Sediminivirga luteola]|uniref:sensor histidine kinase n=1 Tax=Sediminivirga luteola TaxID=1774748 RepID=UPI00166B7CE9|nr:histidine kinase [Sediminivirga luteola]MCI2266565.1 histidine kinase [Sediminivirga luteola]
MSTTRPAPDAAGAPERSGHAERPVNRRGTWTARRPWILDSVIAASVFAYTLPLTLEYRPQGAVLFSAAVLLCLLMCLPYPLLRRRTPLTVLGVALGASLLQSLAGIGLLPANIMLVFALYAVAARCRPALAAAAAAAVLLWLGFAVAPFLRAGHLSPGEAAVLAVTVLWAWTWGALSRVRRERIEAVRERARQLERERETLAAIAAAEERERIAREIHDIVSHNLSVIVVLADGASAKALSEPERARDTMVQVRRTGHEALTEMRRLLGLLRGDEDAVRAPQPGLAQLGALVDASRRAGLPVTLTRDGDASPVPPGIGLALYRVTQEALTNVRRHAGPGARAEVTLCCRGEAIEVRIADDGRGMSRSGPPGDGHGIAGMRERVAACDGTLRAGPRPGGGFEVVASIPLGARS